MKSINQWSERENKIKYMTVNFYFFTHHLIDDQNDGHQTEILPLSFLIENSFQVTFEQLHYEHVMIAFFSKPVYFRNAL